MLSLPRVLSVLLLAAGTVLCGVAVPATAATDTTPPALVDVQIGAAQTSASGFGLAWMDVRLHLTDDTGVVRRQNYDDTGTGSFGNNYPSAILVRTVAGRGQVSRSDQPPAFTLASGTPTDGWWSGSIPLTAGYDGRFRVGLTMAIDAAGNTLVVDPLSLGIDREIQVHGTDIPHLSMRQSPDPAIGVPTGGNGTLTFYGHVTNLDTGAPYRATVHLGFDSECQVPPGGGTHSATADPTGAWRITVGYWSPGAGCASVFNLLPSGVRATYVDLLLAPHYRWPVSATIAPSSIRLGQTATVSGHSGAVGERVDLQRLVSGSWRTVGSAAVRASGRFTLTAQPPSTGNQRYRAHLRPSVRGELASSSATLLLGVSR
jgi:hypothetical protein